MKIGYSVEGSTDRAFVKGLGQRRGWCPGAQLVEGSFRGKLDPRRRMEMPKICRELRHKGADVMVFLTDANDRDWRQVKREEQGWIPPEHADISLVGVADRNVECWIAADAEYLAGKINVRSEDLQTADPKGVFERGLGITTFDKKEPEIAAIVKDAPLRNWLSQSESFADFYDDALDLSQRQGCSIPNERERT